MHVLTTVGSLTVQDVEMLSIEQLSEVNTGNLIFADNTTQTLSLPRLVYNNGALRAYNNSKLLGIVISSLGSVGGNLGVQDNPALLELSKFPLLSSVSADGLLSGPFSGAKSKSNHTSEATYLCRASSAGDSVDHAKHAKIKKGLTTEIIGIAVADGGFLVLVLAALIFFCVHKMQNAKNNVSLDAHCMDSLWPENTNQEKRSPCKVFGGQLGIQRSRMMSMNINEVPGDQVTSVAT